MAVDPVQTFVVGVDLGKSLDSTVIAVLEYKLVGTGDYNVTESGNNVTVTQEKYREHFDLRALQRLKLQTTYDEIIQHIVFLMNTRPLFGADLVIDDSGVGRPTGDLGKRWKRR